MEGLPMTTMSAHDRMSAAASLDARPSWIQRIHLTHPFDPHVAFAIRSAIHNRRVGYF
jgi:hypothetical protein